MIIRLLGTVAAVIKTAIPVRFKQPVIVRWIVIPMGKIKLVGMLILITISKVQMVV